MDYLKEIVLRDPQGADQALLHCDLDPAEASLVIAPFEDMDLATGIVSSPLLGAQLVRSHWSAGGRID
jgi:hypothetical protein